MKTTNEKEPQTTEKYYIMSSVGDTNLYLRKIMNGVDVWTVNSSLMKTFDSEEEAISIIKNVHDNNFLNGVIRLIQM